jgi:hypothetical protein
LHNINYSFRKERISMAYDINVVEPMILPNTINFPVDNIDTPRIIYDATNGSSFPALSGWFLNNSSSPGDITLNFLNGTVLLGGITVTPGSTTGFYVVGADQIAAVSAAAGTTGNLNMTVNSNPL